MGKIKMGRGEHKRHETPKPEIKTIEVEVEKKVEVPVEKVIEKVIEKPIYIKTEVPVSDVESKIMRQIMISDEKIEDIRDEIISMGEDAIKMNENMKNDMKMVEDMIEIQGGSIVDLRDSMASQDQYIEVIEQKLDGLEKVNRYLIAAMAVTIVLSLII